MAGRTVDFPWPRPTGSRSVPVWTGDGFLIDGEISPVIAYGGGASGWSDDLAILQDASCGQHFMEKATRERALGELAQHLPADRMPTILEVGCSAGYFLRELLDYFPGATIIGADYPEESLLRLAPSLPGVPLIQFDLTQCPLPSDSIDAVIALQVLEHIEDHLAAMRHLARILRPGGVAVLEVPAGPGLYDAFDEFVGHFRRYDMAGLVMLAHAAGFECVNRSHLGFLLFPAFWLTKRWNQFHPPRTDEARRAMIREMITASMHPGRLGGWIMRTESWLRRRFYLPVGMRCLLTVRKPTNRLMPEDLS